MREKGRRVSHDVTNSQTLPSLNANTQLSQDGCNEFKDLLLMKLNKLKYDVYAILIGLSR